MPIYYSHMRSINFYFTLIFLMSTLKSVALTRWILIGVYSSSCGLRYIFILQDNLFIVNCCCCRSSWKFDTFWCQFYLLRDCLWLDGSLLLLLFMFNHVISFDLHLICAGCLIFEFIYIIFGSF